jgi:hypothetical protein
VEIADRSGYDRRKGDAKMNRKTLAMAAGLGAVILGCLVVFNVI